MNEIPNPQTVVISPTLKEKPRKSLNRRVPGKLTIKQQKFVQEYISNGGNGTQAALDSYDTNDPAVARSVASENLTKPDVRSSIELALEKAGLNDNTISLNLAKIANSDAEKPLSASEIIKANELILKLKGRFPSKTTLKTTVSLSQRLGDQNFTELKDKLASLKNSAPSLLEDLD